MGAVKVPSEFIRNATELAIIVPHKYFSDEQVPVIDLAGLDDNSRWEATMAAIANACENWGFFQVSLVSSSYHLSWCEDWTSIVKFIVKMWWLNLDHQIQIVTTEFWSSNSLSRIFYFFKANLLQLLSDHEHQLHAMQHLYTWKWNVGSARHDGSVSKLNHLLVGQKKWWWVDDFFWCFCHHQVLNHNILLSLMESAQRVAREFFDLPLEEKQKLASEPNTTPTNGYGRQFCKAKNRTDDWHDLFFQVHCPLTAKALENFPTTPAAYRYLQIHEIHMVLAWKEIICI